MSNFRFKGKNILIISPEPWEHIFVSKHHYAVHLARAGNKVFFLNPPRGALSFHPSLFPNLTIVDYKRFIKGLRFFPGLVQRWLMRSAWRSIERAVAVRFDIIWSFDNSVFFDFNIFPKDVLTISHVVDLNQDFNTQTAARTASICLCTTERIRQRLLLYNRKVFKINHGFNDVETNTSVKLPGANRLKAIYSGNLQMRFIDWKILHCVAREHSDVDFVFVGPGANEEANVSDGNMYKSEIWILPNVFRIGQVSADDLPSYLREADILLVAYLEKYHADQANPHKVMEYLGSGKVVVATKTEEFAGYDTLIQMSDRNDEFPRIFSGVKDDLRSHNSRALLVKRRSVAQNNKYEKQIERIEQIVYELQSG